MNVFITAALSFSLLAGSATAGAAADDAAVFGALEAAHSPALSADGKRLVYIGPAKGGATQAVVVDLAAQKARSVSSADGKPYSITGCDWTAADRLVCSFHGDLPSADGLVPMQRTLAADSDGGNARPLGTAATANSLYARQFDGTVVDWLAGVDGSVLMARNYVPEFSTGKLTASKDEGLGVDRIDTRTGKSRSVESPKKAAVDYISDGLGTIRIMTTAVSDSSGLLRGIYRHSYRKVSEEKWQELGVDRSASTGQTDSSDMWPLAVDPIINAAYVLQPLNGRQALYRIALDGSLKSELVFASPEVDVDNVIRIGRGGRVIGATYATDRRRIEYFDPVYKSLAAKLGRALPKLPLLYFESASADEQMLLIWAGSDVDPGHFYTFDRTRNALAEILLSRPDMADRKVSEVKALSYPAADGTQIPAYLTLPPGVTDAKGLPALVLPHGGPASRDEWGFDWLAQYFAQRGFVVLQPNYRGSSGYGSQWFADNGFRGWKTSVGDVCDAGRWLLAQGIAAPGKLAVFGWSYGGYAALQANVLDADLFKAVIAVAPVTDLARLKQQSIGFTNERLVAKFIGSGPHLEEGSPARNVKAFKAPVLLFHGDLDFNVDVEQSRLMDKALHSSGKTSELVVYPGREHSLLDGEVRADMLRKAEVFLRAQLGLK